MAPDDLRRSEARYRALIEKSHDMVFILDAHWRFQFWGPSAEEQLGWSAAEVLGKEPFEAGLVHPDDRDAAHSAREQALRAPRVSVPGLMRLRRKDGSWRLLESVGRNLLDDPAVGGYVVNARDVTEYRALEEKARQAQKLDGIGRLAGGVAHDLNNILTAILSCAEALREEAVARDPGCLPDVEQILAAGWRARDLTQQLLAFARRQVIVPVRLDLNELLRANEQLYGRALGEAVTLDLELTPGLWPVSCDRALLEQALMQLVVNAREAMPVGGRLVLRTANAPRAEGGQQDLVRLTVQDSGVGMPPEVKAHLFEPFFTTKPLGQRAGLGLATVFGIVSQSNGTIQVESEPGQGTCVALAFPRAAGEQPIARAAPEESRARPGRRGTVLVVDDDPLVLTITVRALSDAGYRVLAAGGGGEAIDVARREPGALDMVVTDVVMPGLSGRAMVDALRVGQPGLPALYVSGYSGEVIAEHGVLDAGIEFLPKPFTPPKLVERVQEILGRAAANEA